MPNPRRQKCAARSFCISTSQMTDKKSETMAAYDQIIVIDSRCLVLLVCLPHTWANQDLSYSIVGVALKVAKIFLLVSARMLVTLFLYISPSLARLVFFFF